MMKLTLIIFLASFCASIPTIVLSDTKSKDIYTQEVLELRNEFLSKLKSDISKEEKCSAIFNHVHSNTQDLFVIMGRLMHFVVNFNKLVQQYSGIKHLEDVAEALWPKLETIANKPPLSRSEYFQSFCLQMKENSNNADLLNKNREYVSTEFSDNNRLIMKTRLDDLFIYLTWVKEGRQWKLFNSSRTLPASGELSASDKQLVGQIITNILLIEKFNTKCYRINKIFLDQNDAKVLLRYKFGDTAIIPHKEIVETANRDADTHVKETIKIFSQFGDCDKAPMKQATFIVSMKLTEGVIDTMKKAVFSSSN
ncbi:hypothetical protein [Kaarinaea lacus]